MSDESARSLKTTRCIVGGSANTLGQLDFALSIAAIVSRAVESAKVDDALRCAYESIRGFEQGRGAKRILALCVERYGGTSDLTTANYQVSKPPVIERCLKAVASLREDFCTRWVIDATKADELELNALANELEYDS